MTKRDYEFDLRLPAAANERRAHGFADDVCTLIVRIRDDRDVSEEYCSLAQDSLPDGDTTLAIVSGDFDGAVARLSHGLVALDSEAAQPMYRVTHSSVLYGLFAANLESLILIRGASQELGGFVNTWSTSDPPWWKFTRQSQVGRLANLYAALGHILVFASSEMSIELIGGKSSLIDALGRLLARASGPSA